MSEETVTTPKKKYAKGWSKARIAKMLASRAKTKRAAKKYAKAAKADAPKVTKGLPNVHAATLYLRKAKHILDNRRVAELTEIDLLVLHAFKALTEKVT